MVGNVSRSSGKQYWLNERRCYGLALQLFLVHFQQSSLEGGSNLLIHDEDAMDPLTLPCSIVDELSIQRNWIAIEIEFFDPLERAMVIGPDRDSEMG